MVRIISPVRKLVTFFAILNLRFSKPQRAHALNFMEGIIMHEDDKTLSGISRLLFDGCHPSSLADFFTYSPWDEQDVRYHLQEALIGWLLRDKQHNLFNDCITISVDDSLVIKPKESKHFELADWHFDANGRGGFAWGISFVTMHMEYRGQSLPVNWRIYLKEQTVRRLNDKYEIEMEFKSKMKLVMEMLEEVKGYLPEGNDIYILFDSWYASKKLIKYCLGNNWNVICALKSNRVFRGKKLSKIARNLGNKSLTRTWVNSAETSALYFTCLRKGKLRGIEKEVSVIISKRHIRDKRPGFFLCTDTSFSAKQALSVYMRRWAIEIDYLYLKKRLGLSDFRVRSMEGIYRYFTLVFLTLVYLSWRKVEEGCKSISHAIAFHRADQHERVLRVFGEKVLQEKSVEPALRIFLPEAA
jgi:hypothetical protein